MDAKWILYFVLVATMSIMMGNSGKPCIEGGVCSLMAKCDNNGSCTASINMTVLNPSNINFVLSDNSSGYIGVGFSVNNQTTGNNTVYGCANNSGVVKLIQATLNDSTVIEVNSATGEIQGMVSDSRMSCNFTVNDLNVTNYLQNGSYIFFISGNFSNGTLGPVTRFSTSSLRDVTSPGATGNNTNATAFGANSTSTTTPSSTTSTKSSTTTSTQRTSSTTTTSTNLADPGNPPSMGNNAIQPNAAKATVILLGAVMVALFSG